MFETIISLASLGMQSFEFVSNIRKGDRTEKLLHQMEQLNFNIHKLSSHIFYAPNLYSITDTSRPKQNTVSNLRYVRETLEPVQKVFQGNILSSALISTPALMQQAMKKNPWTTLIDVRPIHQVTPHSNPDMIPLMFTDAGVYYVGWQLEGILPTLFNCKYEPGLNFDNQQKSAPLKIQSPSSDYTLGLEEDISGNIGKLLEDGLEYKCVLYRDHRIEWIFDGFFLCMK